MKKVMLIIGIILFSFSSFAQDYKYSVSVQAADFFGLGGKLDFQKNLTKHFSVGAYTHFIPAEAVSHTYISLGADGNSTLEQDMDIASFGANGSFNFGILRRVYFKFSASIGGLYYNYNNTNYSFDPNKHITKTEFDFVVAKFKEFSPDQSEIQFAIGAGVDLQIKLTRKLRITLGFTFDNLINPYFKSFRDSVEAVIEKGDVVPSSIDATNFISHLSGGLVYSFGKSKI